MYVLTWLGSIFHKSPSSFQTITNCVCNPEINYKRSEYFCAFFSFLPSAMKLRRLCFYTCLSFCPQGVLPQCMLGYPPEQAPPKQAPPPKADTPRADTPQEQTPPPRSRPPEMATVVDGMHPTGMHSCKLKYFQVVILIHISEIVCITDHTY